MNDFARRVDVYVKDANGEALANSTITFFNGSTGEERGKSTSPTGHASCESKDDPPVPLRVTVSYPGQPVQSVLLSTDQSSYEFQFDVVQHPRGKDFAMKHFPALVGIIFIILAVVLVFVFSQPTPLQTHIVLALFALGGGGFGGEIAGFIKADIKLGQQLLISAGGAAAIFALLYFFVPAGSG